MIDRRCDRVRDRVLGWVRRVAPAHADALVQFAGYFAVSVVALSIDVTAYWLLLSVSRFAAVAAIGGYVCGVLSHYALSSRVVFRGLLSKRGVAAEAPTLARFFAAGFTGLLVTAAIVGVLADVMGLHPLLAKVVAAGCSFFVVFFTLRVLVLKPMAQQQRKDR